MCKDKFKENQSELRWNVDLIYFMGLLKENRKILSLNSNYQIRKLSLILFLSNQLL